MKKITKRIMALMLSLVMIFGCIPSFTNVVSAVEPPKIQIEFTNLADTKSISEIKVSSLNLYKDSKKYTNMVAGGLSEDVTTSIYDFNAIDTKLDESITLNYYTSYYVQSVVKNPTVFSTGMKFLSNFSDFDDTTILDIQGVSDWIVRNAVCDNTDDTVTISFEIFTRTIDDILTTNLDFPENFDTIPVNAWVNENGCLAYFKRKSGFLSLHDSGHLYLQVNRNYAVSSADGGNTYTYYDSEYSNTYNFIMTDGKLTSIKLTGNTGGMEHFNGTYEPVKTAITKVNLTSSGVLATNIQTLTYEVPDDADYTIDVVLSTGWCSDYECNHPYDFTATGDAYKKIVLTPKSGFKFDHETKVYLNRDLVVNGSGNINADGTLSYVRAVDVQAGTISLDFEKPETFTDFNTLKLDRTKFTMLGKNIDDSEQGFEGIDASEYTRDNNDRGYYYIYFTYRFDTPDELNKIKNMIYRNKPITILETPNNDDFLNMNVGDIYCYKINRSSDSKYQIKIFEKFDLRKQATITCPITAGTTVGDIKQAIVDTLTTTPTSSPVSIAPGLDTKPDITIRNLTDDIPLNDTDALESNKEYLVKFLISDTECEVYTSVKINNINLDVCSMLDPDKTNNHFYLQMGSNKIQGCYKFKAQTPSSGGSKKYKANDNDTAEKISGSGKKGSKRIVTPEPNRKVESVIVTDKDGNKYEVTNEGDGTYSFIQPGTNVDVEVKYKNRLIELTIGSLDASVDDIHHNLDVVPKVVNDRTMLPIRFVAENLGAKVDWDEKDPDTVIITRGETKIEITLGSDIAKVNGQEYMLDSVAFAENDRTYLPVRFVSEKLNAIVEWNEAHPMDVKIYERQ